VMVLLLPALLLQWQVLPTQPSNFSLVLLILLSGVLGCGLGGWLYLNPAISKPIVLVGKPIREVLAYDFWIDRLYKASVVFGVVQGARLTNWVDRYIVDGLVNFVGVASIFSGESLKYTISGQSRNYLLTLFAGIFLSLIVAGWAFWGWS
jgi:NAD(P)H-quinone oxidoreductase subunit 5